jgi:hypothetical protein
MVIQKVAQDIKEGRAGLPCDEAGDGLDHDADRALDAWYLSELAHSGAGIRTLQ